MKSENVPNIYLLVENHFRAFFLFLQEVILVEPDLVVLQKSFIFLEENFELNTPCVFLFIVKNFLKSVHFWQKETCHIFTILSKLDLKNLPNGLNSLSLDYHA